MPYICDIIFRYLLIIMKNKSVILLLFLAICGLTEAKAVANDEGANTSNFIYRGTGNPYLPLWEHLPDGEPRVLKIPIIRENTALISSVRMMSALRAIAGLI